VRRRAASRLVFEIGAEELPPAAAWEGLSQLRDAAEAAFRSHRISYRAIAAYATPRRLVLVADGVAPRQEDLVREVRGPAAKAAFTPDGLPTAAAHGFARAQGVAVASLERRTSPQGDYVYAVRREPGAPAAQALARILPGLAEGLTFAKSMRWGAGSHRFARPIRWVLALLGSGVIPMELAGVRAGRRTVGHRTLSPKAVLVPSAGSYEAVLRRSFVLFDPEERRTRIIREITRAAAAAGGRPILDPDLLEETVQLLEWPTALAGGFAREFLALPREVLITVMQHHQKYFAVEDARGHLLPAFVAVRNGGTRGLATVREGNEWVLRARLADARFFFEEDRKRPLASRVGELADLVFLDRLGTVAEKTHRLEALSRRLAEVLALDTGAAEALVRAAHLSKADLVTQMVRELPELQGVMGGIYARLGGEPEAVASAIGEQYLPRGPQRPKTALGAYLALLDKIDTLVGALTAGITPSGSQDPYGLRRTAQGIVAIAVDRDLRLNMRELVSASLDCHAIADAPAREAAADAVLDLLRQRLRAALIEAGIGYDTVDAVLASGADDLADAAARARALWAFRATPEFANVYTAFDRAARILPPAFEAVLQADGLRLPAERGLRDALESARPRVADALRARRYDEALRHLVGLAEPVDRFFTDVLVMDEDRSVRANRLALLAGVVTLIRPIADLSKVVVGEGKPAASR
jgi:glycyl-tRNA synthetase beta chain